jgi:tRNA dimethylallyltransferase
MGADPGAPLLALVGPTASGKTEAGIAAAMALGCEIVSIDSMLVYRGMDIGTAKPSAADRSRVPHHLIDVAEPEEAFSVARYQALAREALAGIDARGRRALLVGGSGLYFRAVVDELEFPGTDEATRGELEAEAETAGPERLYARLAATDPVAASKIEPGNVRRTVRALEVAAVTGRRFSDFAEAWERYPEGRVRAVGVDLSRDALADRIEARVASMLSAGLLREVSALLERGLFGWLTSSQAIGYAEFARHLRDELSLEEAVAGTVKRTKALARRQLAWFRRDPRIRWFEAGERGAEAIVDELAGYLRDA